MYHLSLFKNHYLFPSVMCLLAVLWGGWVRAGTGEEAPLEDYYVFVMQKTSVEKPWQIPSSSELAAGTYRFQVVICYSQKPGELPNPWVALRGEFEFKYEDKQNPEKGVVIKNKQTLDSQPSQVELNTSASIWDTQTDSQSSWEQARQKWVQPLINKMKKEGQSEGLPDPNFMRFLIQEEADKSWDAEGKKYHIYRLHRFTAKNLNSPDYLKALSRFLNPEEELTENIETLTGRMTQDAFRAAGYLSDPDKGHKDFYKDFKAWFDKSFKNVNTSNSPPPKATDANQSWQPLFFKNYIGILIVLVLIVGVVIYFVYFYPSQNQKKLWSNPDFEDEEDVPPSSRRPFQSWRTNTESKEGSSHRGSHKVKVVDDRKVEVENPVRKVMGENLPGFKEEIKEEIPTQLSPHQESKEELLVRIGEEILEKLLQEKIEQAFEPKLARVVRQVLAEKNDGRVAATLPLESTPTPISKPSTAGPKTSQPPPQEVMKKLEVELIRFEAIEAAEVKVCLETSTDLCTLITSVVAQCLKINQSLTAYREVADWLQELTAGKVSLILPQVGDEILPAEHLVMADQVVTKGKLNAVAALIRPGVRCGDQVRRQAEVLRSR